MLDEWESSALKGMFLFQLANSLLSEGFPGKTREVRIEFNLFMISVGIRGLLVSYTEASNI